MFNNKKIKELKGIVSEVSDRLNNTKSLVNCMVVNRLDKMAVQLACNATPFLEEPFKSLSNSLSHQEMSEEIISMKQTVAHLKVRMDLIFDDIRNAPIENLIRRRPGRPRKSKDLK